MVDISKGVADTRYSSPPKKHLKNTDTTTATFLFGYPPPELDLDTPDLNYFGHFSPSTKQNKKQRREGQNIFYVIEMDTFSLPK